MIKYDKDIWSFKGFRKEIDRLCKAFKQIEKSCKKLSKTLEKTIKYYDKLR